MSRPLMRFSANFLYSELIVSDKASEHGIDNTPVTREVMALAALVHHVAQPLRSKLGKLKVNSGFRCLELNRLVGSEDTSQHPRGEALDLVPLEVNLQRAFDYLVFESGLVFDQAIIYPDRGFFHVSYTMRRENRSQVLQSLTPGHYAAYRRA